MLISTLFTYPVNSESATSLKTLSATWVASSLPTSAVSSAEKFRVRFFQYVPQSPLPVPLPS
ncbi:secreted protein [methanotrophic bacterial endosymbiont of Bathymodiolus sp.]|nr:secreted protein [methanotrophic bacterial endosymbiont of Bathymodiolus sp.]